MKSLHGLVTVLLTLGFVLFSAEAGGSSRSPGDRLASEGVYSTEQAGRGQSAYEAKCTQCHGDDLSGGDFGPALVGNTFTNDFGGKSLADLFGRVQSTMPQNNPGSLSAQQVTDIVAYLLKNNDFRPGATELSTDPDVLKSIKCDVKQSDSH